MLALSIERGGRHDLTWLSTAAGGAALGLAFPPISMPLLGCIAWLPLFVAWSGTRSARRAMLLGVVFYGACFLVAFSWPLTHVMATTRVASAVPLLLLILALACPVAASVIVRRRSGTGLGLLTLICLHLLVEAVLARGPLALPWPLVGYSLAEIEPLRQLASLGGVALLSAWVLAANVLLFSGLRASGSRRAAVVASLLLFFVGSWYGSRALRSEVGPEAEVVAIVQPALAARAWGEISDRGRVHSLMRLTDSLQTVSAGSATLTIWPETALPPCPDSEVCDDVQSLLRHAGVPAQLLTGAIISDARPTGARGARRHYYNAALYFESGELKARYDKRRLVPFAEGVPFAESLPSLSVLAVPAGGVSSYRSGTRRSIMHVGSRRIGVLICFESSFSQEAVSYARAGVDVIVVLSQDGWWRYPAGAAQHLAWTRLRAIETRTPVVFASASGPSAVIAPDGSTTGRLPYGRQSARLLSVPARGAPSLYVRYGDWVFRLAVFLMLVSGMALARRPRPRPV